MPQIVSLELLLGTFSLLLLGLLLTCPPGGFREERIQRK